MASMMGCGAIAPGPPVTPSSIVPAGTPMNGTASAVTSEDMIQCRRCGYPGCDVRVTSCGCCLHARCTPLPSSLPMSACPFCNRPLDGLVLFAMSFCEIDEAQRALTVLASNGKRGRKRKDPPSGRSDQHDLMEHDKFTDPSGLRMGRWTNEEMAYTDELITKFKEGQLPLVDGIKLNDFLANMLKSKQSRLTKKMKNANLSSKSFKRTTGYVANHGETQNFSLLEDAFFRSIQSQQEKAEIRFHMQKEWRELFSSFCVSVGQPLDADMWLGSVEEMDRRAAATKEVARMARRKMMMGHALSQDIQNPDKGVFIERISSGQIPSQETMMTASSSSADADDLLSLLSEKNVGGSLKRGNNASNNRGGITGSERGRSSYQHASPFLSKVICYLQRHNMPFEHVDAWVPSFVPSENNVANGGTDSKCRLCFAGLATADVVSRQVRDGSNESKFLSQEDQSHLIAFGEYSQKFSFNVGCGLPGRVYQSGVPTWEQSVQNAPHHHFERCGGAIQYGIKTVVGLPVPSPNVGRIVLVLYSREDRKKDQELVGKLCEEFRKLLPTPKWKLVVDIGQPSSATGVIEHASASSGTVSQTAQTSAAGQPASGNKDSSVEELVSLLGEHMPSDSSSPFSSYLQGFMSLRLMLLRTSRTQREEDLVQTLLSSYLSYSTAGRTKADIAAMLARDFLFLQHQQSQQQQQVQPQPPQQQVQPQPLQQSQPQQHPQQQQQHQQTQPQSQTQPVPQPQAATGMAAGNASQAQAVSATSYQWQQQEVTSIVAPAPNAAMTTGQNSSSWLRYQQGMPPAGL